MVRMDGAGVVMDIPFTLMVSLIGGADSSPLPGGVTSPGRLLPGVLNEGGIIALKRLQRFLLGCGETGGSAAGRVLRTEEWLR